MKKYLQGEKNISTHNINILCCMCLHDSVGVKKKPTPTALFFNCGYARVCIRETLNEDPSTSQREFHTQFSECSEYGLSDEYFNDRGKNKSKFEHARQVILQAFTKKWYPHEAKHTYITTFSRANWKALAKGDKQKHTFSFCKQCREQYFNLQEVFPAKPVFSHPTTTTVMLSSNTNNERELTHAVLQDLNGTYVQQFGHTFIDSMVKNCKEIDRKKTKTEKKREQQNLLKKCQDKVNKQMAENVALHTLAEDESLLTIRENVCPNHLRSHRHQKSQNPTHLQVPTFQLIKKMCYRN